MKIFIDIGHPAHVHYFRNLIDIMSKKGHQFKIVARNRDIIKSLLDYYDIPYVDRGKGKDSLAGKMTYMLYADLLMYKNAKQFNPDVFLSFVSPYPAQVSKLLGIPYIAITDSEHQDNAHKIFTYPFTDVIITPNIYENDLGHKHIKIRSFNEYFYLHPEFYEPDKSIYKLLGIAKGEQYAILRFISWKAFHDVNQKGLSIDLKREIVKILEKKYRVFITSEAKLESEFEKYQIKIPPERMHDALAFASLFVGESGTMASESAMLGVPVVYINSLPLMCYLKEEQNFGILKHFSNSTGVMEYIHTVVDDNSLKKRTIKKRNRMVENFINPTKFLVWFIENWPNSKTMLKANPEYQENFK